MTARQKQSKRQVKTLFTPGPLTTSRSVKEAMLRDFGSRNTEFIATVKRIRRELVALGGVSGEDYTAIPMQGSGTFGIEAVIGSTVPPNGKLLVAVNGAYGKRIVGIASVLNIEVVPLSFPENCKINPNKVADALTDDPEITNVAVVHCETTTGIINPIEEIGALVAHEKRAYFVDAMSSFGAIPVNLAESRIDYLVSSANKCLEGVPGFSFVLAKLSTLQATEGWARSLSLDILAQHNGLEANGQFRFTPPTHALLAFRQALQELAAEGGVAGRAARYRANYEALTAGMRAMGFKEYLQPDDQGYIITSFHCPQNARFRFDDFYQRLSDKGCVIYPGKVSDADCFRIGTIGRITTADIDGLLAAIRATLAEMNVELRTVG